MIARKPGQDKNHTFLWDYLRVVIGSSLAVQWLVLHASTAGGTGLIPGQGTKIPHAMWQKKKKKKW